MTTTRTIRNEIMHSVMTADSVNDTVQLILNAFYEEVPLPPRLTTAIRADIAFYGDSLAVRMTDHDAFDTALQEWIDRAFVTMSALDSE